MKRYYVKPQMEMIVLSVNEIMAGSGPDTGSNTGGDVKGPDSGSDQSENPAKFNSSSLWDDEL